MRRKLAGWIGVLGLLLGGGLSLQAGPGAVVLRGTLTWGKVAKLDYVAELDSLDQAQYAGVTGQGIMSEYGKQLRVQAEFYAEAQRAARGDGKGVTPLYVILDPEGDWAYAQSVAEFSYPVQGKSSGKIRSPVLLLGEKRHYDPAVAGVGPRSQTFNRYLRSLAGDFVRRELRAAGKPEIDLDAEVLSTTKLIFGESEEVNMVDSGDRLTEKTYLNWLGQVVARDLSRRGLDGEQLWKSFLQEVGIEAKLARQQELAVLDQVASSISHEMGHLVHFMAVGPNGFSMGNNPPHMNGTSHTFQTLSNPEFALVEGWAAANSIFTLGLPEPVSSPGAANRIDYGTSVASVDRKRNQGLATLAARISGKRKLLPEGQALSVPAYDSPPEEFRTQLWAQLATQGFTEEDLAQLAEQEQNSAEMQQLERAQAYLHELQDRKGELRSRYDFLRSEFAVGSALAALRQSLGKQDGWRILKTLATHQPKNFADLVEHYVHDFPELRGRLYRELARITEGILVTLEQAEGVEQLLTAEPGLEIDLDRNGKVPGKSANLAHPELFPEETLLARSPDPLAWSASLADSQKIFASESATQKHGGLRPEPPTRLLEEDGWASEGAEIPGMDGLSFH